MFADAQTLRQSTNVLEQASQAIFNSRSILVLIAALIIGSLLGRLITGLIGRISKDIGNRADRAADLTVVKRLRRVETILVLSTAIVRLIFVGLGIYVWWVFTHPTQKPTALIGAGALIALLLNGVFSPILRDIAFGSSMMAEQWYGVGDLIHIELFDIMGVVERITLRSTKLRELSGDTVWITNQNIAAAKIIRKGVRAMALEVFVSELDKTDRLIEETNLLLPIGPSLVVSPLRIMSTVKLAPRIWRLIVIGETAPSREYLLEQNAIQILKDLDKRKKYDTLLAEPIARYADTDAERQFGRAINNARKTRQRSRRKLPLKLDRKTKAKQN